MLLDMNNVMSTVIETALGPRLAPVGGRDVPS